MKKIVTIIGARPQFVKAAAVSRAIKADKTFTEVIVHTGQHFDADMSDIFFQEMEIPAAKYNLAINGGSHGSMTGRMLEAIEKVILEEKPEWVLVYGDTNSTLAGALAASKLHFKVAHVEAGLRSFNMQMPEEINRILTDRVSSLLLCPTPTAVKNLEAEGYSKFDIRMEVTGDVMLDAALFYEEKSRRESRILDSLNLPQFALCTIHRAENTNDPERLKEIVDGLNELNDSIPVILPLHPRTKGIIQEHGLKLNARVLKPVGYFDMLTLLRNCQLVLTDSGGLQKEAYFFEKPCLTLRDQTEWTELVDAGVNRLVGTSKKALIDGFNYFSQAKLDFSAKFYGAGNASTKIVEALKR